MKSQSGAWVQAQSDRLVMQQNDILYKALFGMNRRELLTHFGLPEKHLRDVNDNAICDEMGTLALQAVGETHKRIGLFLGTLEGKQLPTERLSEITRLTAELVAIEFRPRVEATGKSFLEAM